MSEESDKYEIDETSTSTRTVYDMGEDERPSEAVVRAVARATNTDVLGLDPLYEEIDPDHLNAITDKTNDGDTHRTHSITFPFNGCQITVNRDSIEIRRGAD